MEPCVYNGRRHGRSSLGGPGILTTAGNLLVSGDYNGNLIAFNATNGDILWHFPMLRSLGNGPETYMLDGRQYLIAGARRHPLRVRAELARLS